MAHLEHPNTCVGILFVDFNSAFNNVIPDKLTLRLYNLGLSVRDFLTNRPQVVRIGDCTSITLVQHRALCSARLSLPSLHMNFLLFIPQTCS